MTLKSKNLPKSEGMSAQGPIEAGNYLARLVQVIDLGLQTQPPFKGEEKRPAHMIWLTFELVTEFCKDEDGNDIEDKPRWISEKKPFYGIEADRAVTTKWYFAMDPDCAHEGDWEELLGAACTVTVVQNPGKGKNAGKIYNNIGAITPPMKGIPVPDLINKPVVFSLDTPDMEVFKSLPEFLQTIIKENLEFNGSDLQKMIGETPQEEEDEQQEKPSTETESLDNPF